MRRAFIGISTLEELKKLYRDMAMKYHPDRGGDLETMKEINSLYDEFFQILKDKHKDREGEYYTRTTNEVPADFKTVINKLLKMEGIQIEIIGSFIWVSGNTKPHRNKLKEMNFKWHSAKKMWYKAPENYRRFGKHDYSIDEIRDMYGTSGTFYGKESEAEFRFQLEV